MKDFLQDLDVRYEAASFGDEPFDDALCIHLAGMRRPDEVHRDVRIDEDHSPDP